MDWYRRYLEGAFTMEYTPVYDVRTIRDLKEMISESEKQFGSKNAFLVKSGENTYKGISYTEFKNDLDAFGTALLGLELKDKFIAVIGENRYEWCVTYLSTVNGAGVIVPLDKELPVAEIENLLTRSNAEAVVFSGKLEKEIRKIMPVLSSIKYYINMDADQDGNGFLSFRQLVKKGREHIKSGDCSYINTRVDNERLSILLFTSGTTDLAKGVMLSHKNLCSDIMAIGKTLYIDEKDLTLSILPLHHTYECTTDFLFMIYRGCTISFNEGLKHISKNLKEVKPTVLVLVPLILENMHKKIWEQAAKSGKKTKLKLALTVSDIIYKFLKIDIRKRLFRQIHENVGGRVRLIISGAAAINPEISRSFHSMGLNLLQGYGLTECSPVVSVSRESDFKHDTIGQPLPGIEVKIDSPGEGGIGEVMVKGVIVMLGYFQNQLATEKVMKDGWLYTGDLGCIDKDGFIKITGRKKNVIVTKNGKNVFPEEVEAYLNNSPYIVESLVWGKHEELSGETLVHAQIVPDIDAIKERLKTDKISQDDIYRFVNSEVKSINKMMPLYKHIKQFTIREEEFAKTTTKKIKRYVEKTG